MPRLRASYSRRAVAETSPYDGLAPSAWRARTDELIAKHPLDMDDTRDVVLATWASIFRSNIGTQGFVIGRDILPSPQIMAFLLHELIPLELQARRPNDWRRDTASDEKDLVYVPDPSLSVEIKASSHARQIFGNRSYAQPSTAAKKSKSGYYLAVNFEKFDASGRTPEIRMIRFGWLDHTDWIAQVAQTGQQAHVSAEADATKLVRIYPTG